MIESNHFFTKVDTRIGVVVGQQFNPFVLKSIKTMAVTLPPEPTLVTEVDGVTITKVEETKYGKKFDQWLTMTDRIEHQLNQLYSIYYGAMQQGHQGKPCEAHFKLAHQEKNLIQLYKIL